MKNILKALLAVQMGMVNPKKTAKNPFFKSTYADLNSVREATIPDCNEHGIIVTQPLIRVEGEDYVRTTLTHAESGESIHSDTKIVFAGKDNPQAQGSGISYARRYGLSAIFCLGADDDDGNLANKKKETETQKDKSPDYIAALQKCENLTDLQSIWGKIPSEGKKNKAVLEAKDVQKKKIDESGKKEGGK